MNNVVRTTIQALAGVLGGTQSLHTNSWDETLALPTEDAVRTALRTQQILAHESGVINTVDPLAGSYFVERLTDELESEAQEYFNKIDEQGGMLQAIENGYPQREIIEAALRYQKQVERQEKIIVGVNAFKVSDEVPIETLKIPPAVEQQQIERIREVKRQRSDHEVETALADLKREAKTAKNLMPAVRNAVRSYATIGEMCRALKEVFGEYHDPGHY